MYLDADLEDLAQQLRVLDGPCNDGFGDIRQLHGVGSSQHDAAPQLLEKAAHAHPNGMVLLEVLGDDGPDSLLIISGQQWVQLLHGHVDVVELVGTPRGVRVDDICDLGQQQSVLLRLIASSAEFLLKQWCL